MTHPMLDGDTQKQYTLLLDHLRGYGRLAVAFSGGVDSTLLLLAAREALGVENTLGINAASATLAPGESAAAIALADELGLPCRVVEFNEFEIEHFAENPPDRCYHCKRHLLGRLLEAARAEGIDTLADGTTLDDKVDDYRPGMRASREMGIVSPLLDLGVRKPEIRTLSRALGLANWDKPSAACLASRFPYGATITPERLDQVARAEAALRREGFGQLRVRYHDSVARIEVPPADLPRLIDEPVRKRLLAALKEIGFRYVALDLEGYRTGSLNEVL